MAQNSPVRNKLLLALPADVRTRLLSRLHPVDCPVRKNVLVSGQPIGTVYFVERGWISLVAQLEEGAQAEVGLIGREGMVGVELAAGIDTAFSEGYVQADGSALQMDAAQFQRELDEIPVLRKLLLRYNEALHAQTAQTAACNGRHNLEQRLARWLLMAHDRGDGDNLPLTQEFLSMMLCVHRPSITIVARVLQQAGIIRYSKGSIAILDRSALEASACECYAVVAQRFRQLLG